MKEKLLLLIREFYKGYISNKINPKIYSEFEKYLRDYVSYKAQRYKNLVDTDILVEEAQSIIIMSLVRSFQNSGSLWDEFVMDNDENFKRMKSYFYRIIVNDLWHTVNLYKPKECQNLYSNIKNILKELKEENIIIKIADDNYKLNIDCNVGNEITEVVNEIKLPYFADISTEQGRINREKLKEILIDIFKRYKENSFEPVDLLEIVSDASGYGNSLEISLYNTVDDEKELTIIDVKPNNDKTDNELEDWQLAKEIFDEMDMLLYNDPRKQLKYKIFLMKFRNDLTLQEMEKQIQENLKKSSIHNYLNEMLVLCEKLFYKYSVESGNVKIVEYLCKIIEEEIK